MARPAEEAGLAPQGDGSWIGAAGIRRRTFITLIGGAAATWPLAARAQQVERMRRIGVLMALAADDPDTKARVAAFRRELERRGWSEGRNVRIDYRLAGAGTDRYLPLARELIASQPDVILAQSSPIAALVQRETRAIPIVFVNVSDPIGAGLIASLARPGGNFTGVSQYEPGISKRGKTGGGGMIIRFTRQGESDSLWEWLRLQTSTA